MKRTCLAVLVLLLAACAAAPDSKRVSDAATTPLSDLNLVHAPIPPVLLEAQQAPYVTPVDQSCEVMRDHVHSLDEVLGPDLDAPPAANDPGLVERGGAAVGNAAVGALRGAAEGIVPYRGWIRKLTGAERYSRQVAAAITAGTVRRSFLKGVLMARGCTSV